MHAHRFHLDALGQLIDDSPKPGPWAPGHSAFLLHGDGREAFASTGFSVAGTQTPNSPRTRFHAASIAKPFTAYLVHRLVAEGRFGFDTAVDELLADRWPHARGITVQQLLDHRSGLHDFWPFSTLAGHTSGDIVDAAGVRAIMRAVRSWSFPAGASYLYCNTGFLILADVIERLHGQPIATVARQAIFRPLGLDDTSFIDDWRAQCGGLAVAYAATPTGYREHTARYAVPGPTSLVTSARDLARWSKYVLSGDDPAIASMLRPHTHWYRFGFGYANGLLQVQRADGSRVIGHSGADWGFYASWFIDLASGQAAGVLSNGNNAKAEQSALRLLMEPFDDAAVDTHPGFPLPLADGESRLFRNQHRNIMFEGFAGGLRVPSLGDVFIPWDSRKGHYRLPGYCGHAAFHPARDGRWRCQWVSPHDSFEILDAEPQQQERWPALSIRRLFIEDTNLAVKIEPDADGIHLVMGDMHIIPMRRVDASLCVGGGFTLALLPQDEPDGCVARLFHPRARGIGLYQR